MPTRPLPRADWKPYLEQVSQLLKATNATVEVEDLDLGVQLEAEHVPLHGIHYDIRDDTLEIDLQGVAHRIERPTRITVEESAEGLESMEVVDADGGRQVLRLQRALTLTG